MLLTNKFESYYYLKLHRTRSYKVCFVYVKLAGQITLHQLEVGGDYMCERLWWSITFAELAPWPEILAHPLCAVACNRVSQCTLGQKDAQGRPFTKPTL